MTIDSLSLAHFSTSVWRVRQSEVSMYLLDSSGEARPLHQAKEYVCLGAGFGAVQGLNAAFPVVELSDGEYAAYQARLERAAAPHLGHHGFNYTSAALARGREAEAEAARCWAAIGCSIRTLATGEEVACN